MARPAPRRGAARKPAPKRSRSGAARQRRKSDPGAPIATLAGLIQDLGTGVIDVLAAPRGLEVTVTEPVIFDPADPPPFESGDVVLAVGVRPDDRDAVPLIRNAGARGATAIVFKIHEMPAALLDAAEKAGVALIGVPLEVRWDQVWTLLRTTIAGTARPRESEAGGIPVGDLFALANAVAAMVGGPTTIEDPQSRVLAFSSLDDAIDEPRRQTILGRRVPESWVKRLHEAGVFRQLWSSQDAIKIELPYRGLRRRLAIAVRAGDEILGSIWVMEGRGRLGPQAEAALKEAAGLAALHLIRHRASEDIERRMRGDLLRSVLEGRGPIEVGASRLGIDPKSSFTVLAFELQATEEAEAEVKRERALDLVTLYCEAFRRRVSCVSIGRVIYALLPTPEPLSRERLLDLAREVIEHADAALSVRLNAGIGSTVPHLREAPRSRWEADQVLRMLSGGGEREVAGIDDVRAHTILLELQDLADERPHLRLGKLQTLVEHDDRRGTHYIETLRAYLDNFGDIAAAAAATNVHPNTFRYRVRRLIDLSGIDLGDSAERLVTELQLRLLG